MFVVADIDNTLGQNVHEIKAGLNLLREFSAHYNYCLVTGRSLRALQDIASEIPTGTFVSPWGGGNLFQVEGNLLFSVVPIQGISVVDGLLDYTWINVPCNSPLSYEDEIHTSSRIVQSDGNSVNVGAYKKIPYKDEDSNAGTYRQHRGLSKSWWDLICPWTCPRLHLVTLLKQLNDCPIIYLGDDAPDGDCIGAVDFFLTPANSNLAERSGVILYSSHTELRSRIEGIVESQ